MLLTRLAIKVAMVCGVLALGGPVAGVSAAYPPGDPPSFGPFLVANPNPVGAGGEFELTVYSCTKGDVIPFTFEGRTVNATCTNPHAKARFTAPTKPGTYRASAVVNRLTIERSVTVITSGPTSGLPTTGSSNPNLLLSIGTSILLTGGLAYVVSRRRHPIAA